MRRAAADCRSGGTALPPKDGGELRPYALEVEQHRAGRRRRVCPTLGEQRVALGFDRLDLVEQQLQPVEFTCDGGLEIVQQQAPVACAQFVEPFAAVAPERLVVGDPLREQQSLDAIDVLDALGDQRLAFATEAAPVLLLRGGRDGHGADARLAALERQQRPQQSLAVEPVGLGAAAAAGGGDRRRVDDVAFDALALQQAVQPEAVEAGLLDRDDGKSFPVRALALRFSSAKRSSSAETSAPARSASTSFRRLQAKAT